MDKIQKLLKILGPGFITGASDDDPSGIGTYSQTGAQFGYSQLWLALFSFPFMTVVQEMCGRIGIVSGKGLARIIKKNYPKPILYALVLILFIANTVNIGADLGAMAASSQLLLGLPYMVWLLILTIGSILLQVLVPYRTYSQYLKYLTISLFAYIIAAFVLKLDWTTILWSTFIPHFHLTKDYLMNIVAILGTTISPYLFFWQASEEVELLVKEEKLKNMSVGKPQVSGQDVKKMQLDTMVGMLFSQVVMFFIIVTTAATLHVHHITQIESPSQAAMALKPIAGDFAFILFALGIIGTGLLAVPILAGSASYAVSEALGWKLGLYKKPWEAKAFYGIIVLSTTLGYFINFIKIPAFKMLYYTAVLNGICAPPLMVMIVLIASNKNIMGEHVSSRFSVWAGWLITILMTVSAVGLLLNLQQS